MSSSLKHFFAGEKPATIHEGVFIQLRLPRVLLCAITGAILAVSGVLMQGLFRNPIVEPGLVGTSAGAAFGASLVFVFGVPLFTPGGTFGLFAPPARNITFWSLGTFTTANVRGVALVAVAFAIGMIGVTRDAKALNALMLGE